MPDIQTPGIPVGTSSASEPTVYSTDIIPDDFVANFTADDSPSMLTEECALRARWVFDNKILCGAIAARPGTSGPDTEFIRVALPNAKLNVEWTVSKIGDTPDIPDPNVRDANYILLRTEFDLANIEPQADGALMITCSGQYWYGTVQRGQSTMGYPRPIYCTIVDGTIAILQAVDFTSGLINNQWPNTTGVSSVPDH